MPRSSTAAARTRGHREAGSPQAFEAGVNLGDGGCAYFQSGLLEKELQDQDAAERASRRGLELGSASASHSLGSILRNRGEDFQERSRRSNLGEEPEGGCGALCGKAEVHLWGAQEVYEEGARRGDDLSALRLGE